jgi:hypothetical protein
VSFIVLLKAAATDLTSHWTFCIQALDPATKSLAELQKVAKIDIRA